MGRKHVLPLRHVWGTRMLFSEAEFGLRNLRWRLFLGTAWLAALAGSLVRAEDALDLAVRRELFVDRYLIDELEGTWLKLHQPVPAGAALKFDLPWEGGTSSYYTVLKDGDTYRMYYRGSSGQPGHIQVTCYAESRDGVQWTKPNVALFEVQGTSENNVILTPEFAGPATHNFCPFIDQNPGTPLSQRFKAVGGDGRGLIPFASADGIRWKRLADRPVITKGAFDSQNVAFWSSSERCYVCYFRVRQDGFRSVARATSADFLNWSDPIAMSFGDTPREHIYTNGTHPYFRAPHIYVALARRFLPGRRVLSDGQVQALDLEKPGSYRGLKNDCSETIFMTSRGGARYDRTFLEGFVRPGLDLRNWVSRSNTPALGVVPTDPAEMSLYVGRHRGQPSHYLERLTLRIDGFASIHAPYRGGRMTTKPLSHAGRELAINYSTSAAGSVRIEITNAEGRPIEGFALDQCDELVGDELDRVVTWQGRGDVSMLAGQTIRLLFVMKDADLYSLQFR